MPSGMDLHKNLVVLHLDQNRILSVLLNSGAQLTGQFLTVSIFRNNEDLARTDLVQ